MNNVVLATLCFTAGVGLGFTVGYYLNKKESETREREAIEAFEKYKQESSLDENSQGEEIEKSESVVKEFPDFKPARFAKPDSTGINYTKYNKDVQAIKDSVAPPDDDPDNPEEYDDDNIELDESDYEETYEERLERESQERIEAIEEYRAEHAGMIELMRSDEWDTDFPETDYEREDLYYFTESDILTDENGKKLDEEEYIGLKPRQVGWMRSPDDVIYIRNHPKEFEYRVFKERCTVEDWF